MSLGRVCILLMDSLGVGASLDAAEYGDEGANTFGHIVEACREGRADNGLRAGALHIPHLARLGMYHAAVASSGLKMIDLATLKMPAGLYGYAVEQSLGNASGTDIITELGDEHRLTGKPIVYTSADSVLQIAAHETDFGLQRLYALCDIARQLVDKYQVGRVIARPFTGETGSYSRTGNRRDYSTRPPAKTLLDDLQQAGRDVVAIGKTADIFAHQGMTQTIKAEGNMALFDATLDAMRNVSAGSLVFTNFVDFDSSYGHRRDIAGYANALEQFDARLPELEALLQPQDLIVIVADHGCDPTSLGSDHTREHIPVLVSGPQIKGRFIGRRDTFADVGQSLAEYLAMQPLAHGVSFFE